MEGRSLGWYSETTEHKRKILKKFLKKVWKLTFQVLTSQKICYMTEGEKRIRVDFNVGQSSKVYEIKKKSAELIDLVDQLNPKLTREDFDLGEFRRLISLAKTAYEEASMWAVKAETL